MARTQAADYGQRRGEILNQAAELFAKRGFHATSVADIARACAMTKSLIYHYFAAKEDILFEVMDSHLQVLEDIATNEAPRGLPAADQLRALSRLFMRQYVGAVARHKVLLGDISHLPPPQKQAILDRQRRIVDRVQKVLSQIAPALDQTPAYKGPAAMVYFGMINWTHTWFSPHGDLSPDQVADLITDTMLEGVKSSIASAQSRAR